MLDRHSVSAASRALTASWYWVIIGRKKVKYSTGRMTTTSSPESTRISTYTGRLITCNTCMITASTKKMAAKIRINERSGIGFC